MPQYSQVAYDALTVLKGAGLVAATTTESTILDIGAGLIDANMIIDVSAIEVASGDEKYTIHLEASNTADMSSGSVIIASALMGNLTAPADSATGVGRFVIPFRNEKDDTLYRYVRLYTLVAGTIATGINFSAYLSIRP